MLAASAYLLGEIKVHGANLRDPGQGYGQQDLHVDVPKRFDDDWWVVNAMIMFDDMTLDNGPTRVVPGSHRWAPINVPYVNQGDWEPDPFPPKTRQRMPADLGAPYPGEVHGHGAGRFGDHLQFVDVAQRHAQEDRRAHRRMLHLTYTRRDLPQQLVQLDYLTQDALRPHEPGAPLSAGDRAAGRRRGAAAEEARPQGLVELNVPASS